MKAFIWDKAESLRPVTESKEIAHGGELRRITVINPDEFSEAVLSTSAYKLSKSTEYSKSSSSSLVWDIGSGLSKAPVISNLFADEIPSGTVNGYKDFSSYNTIEFYAYSPQCTNSNYQISISTNGNISGTYTGVIDWQGWKKLSLNFNKDFILSNECNVKICDDNYKYTLDNAKISFKVPSGAMRMSDEAVLYIDNIDFVYYTDPKIDSIRITDEEYEKVRQNRIHKLIGEDDFTQISSDDSGLKAKMKYYNQLAKKTGVICIRLPKA